MSFVKQGAHTPRVLRGGLLLAMLATVSCGSSNDSHNVTAGGAGGASVSSGGSTSAEGTSPFGGTTAGGGVTQESPQTTTPAPTVMTSTPSGAYVMPISVELSTLAAGGEVRYTLDGTVPTTASQLASAAIPIADTTELRAATFVDGVLTGEPSVFVYVARSVDATSELPLMILDDYGAGVPTKEVALKTALLLVEPTGTTSTLGAPATVASRAGVHLRGQTSVEFDQKGFKVELWDASNDDTDLSLLSLPAESDWVLHNPYADKSLIRNAFAYGLGPELGLLAPKFGFVELYFNTDDRPLDQEDYQGVYLLVESIKNSKNRLDLAQLRETDTALPDISGGYILKFELDVAEEPTLACQSAYPNTCWLDLEVSDPSPLNAEQQTYITGHIQQFNDTLFGASYTDATAGYSSFVEVDSFVNYFILQELTRNLDAYIRSMYFHKDRDAKLTAGPLWDYNLMGGIGCCGNDPIEGWQHEVTRNGEANGWLQRMATDPAFMDKVVTRYRELRGTVLSDAAIDERIATLTAPLTNAASRHFAKWPILTQEQIVYFTTTTEDTWQGQVSSFSTWLHERAAWLDTQW